MSTPPLAPLAVLYEADGLPRFTLPTELEALYGGSLGFHESCLFANFVVTIDGVTAISSLRRSNVLISDASESDRFVMGVLRACADVVLVGSGTVHGSSSRRWTAAAVYPPAADAYDRLRRELGRPPEPELAILTSSGALDVAHPALEAGALVLTTARGAARLRGRLPAASQAVAVCDGELDARAAVDHLRARGHRRLLSEGGPTVFGSLLVAGLVDELFLTISPLVAGRTARGDRLGLVEQAELMPPPQVRGTLLGVRSHGAHLFLRYGLERTPAPQAS